MESTFIGGPIFIHKAVRQTFEATPATVQFYSKHMFWKACLRFWLPLICLVTPFAWNLNRGLRLTSFPISWRCSIRFKQWKRTKELNTENWRKKPNKCLQRMWRHWCHDGCTLKKNMLLYMCFWLLCFAALKEMPQTVFLDVDNEWEKRAVEWNKKIQEGDYTCEGNSGRPTGRTASRACWGPARRPCLTGSNRDMHRPCDTVAGTVLRIAK